MGRGIEIVYELKNKLLVNKKDYVIDTPMVSVVVKAHNDEKTIIKCLRALSKQSLEEIEIIVVDENSTDATYSLACTYSEVDNRVKVFKQNEGTDTSKLVKSDKVVTISAKKIVNKRFVEKSKLSELEVLND